MSRPQGRGSHSPPPAHSPRPGPHTSPVTSLPLSTQGPVQPHPSCPPPRPPQVWGTAVAVPALSWQYHSVPLCSKYQTCPRAEGTSCEGWGDGPWEGQRGFLPSFCPGPCKLLSRPSVAEARQRSHHLKGGSVLSSAEGGFTLCPSTGQQSGSSHKILSLLLEPPLADVYMQKDAS